MSIIYEVRYTAPAQNDIGELLSYIASNNVSGAEEFIREMQNQVDSLKTFPYRCAVIPERDSLTDSFRHLLFGPYRTIFQVADSTVHILRVIHGARLIDQLEMGDDFPK